MEEEIIEPEVVVAPQNGDKPQPWRVSELVYLLLTMQAPTLGSAGVAACLVTYGAKQGGYTERMDDFLRNYSWLGASPIETWNNFLRFSDTLRSFNVLAKDDNERQLIEAIGQAAHRYFLEQIRRSHTMKNRDDEAVYHNMKVALTKRICQQDMNQEDRELERLISTGFKFCCIKNVTDSHMRSNAVVEHSPDQMFLKFYGRMRAWYSISAGLYWDDLLLKGYKECIRIRGERNIRPQFKSLDVVLAFIKRWWLVSQYFFQLSDGKKNPSQALFLFLESMTYLLAHLVGEGVFEWRHMSLHFKGVVDLLLQSSQGEESRQMVVNLLKWCDTEKGYLQAVLRELSGFWSSCANSNFRLHNQKELLQKVCVDFKKELRLHALQYIDTHFNDDVITQRARTQFRQDVKSYIRRPLWGVLTLLPVALVCVFICLYRCIRYGRFFKPTVPVFTKENDFMSGKAALAYINQSTSVPASPVEERPQPPARARAM